LQIVLVFATAMQVAVLECGKLLSKGYMQATTKLFWLLVKDCLVTRPPLNPPRTTPTITPTSLSNSFFFHFQLLKYNFQPPKQYSKWQLKK
jgi:hypothetical protein